MKELDWVFLSFFWEGTVKFGSEVTHDDVNTSVIKMDHVVDKHVLVWGVISIGEEIPVEVFADTVPEY